MKKSLDVLADIPCFRCIFWEWKKDSHLYCNPQECQKLTEWLLEQAEDVQHAESKILIVTASAIDKKKK